MTLPTQRLQILDTDAALDEIQAFAARLIEAGERPWFEVRYPAPAHLSPEQASEWLVSQEGTFDAVEVVDGAIVTLPPYSVLEAAQS